MFDFETKPTASTDASAARTQFAYDSQREVFMSTRICKYVPRFILFASLGIAGCSNDGVSLSTASLTGPAPATSGIVTVEPRTIRPDFLPRSFCHTPPAFQTRFTLVVSAVDDLTVRGVSFEFLDRFGRRSFPTLIPSSSPIPIPGTSPIPTPGTSPIPTPGTSPITTPGFSPFDSVLVLPGTSHLFPFLLQFDCGIPAFGTLFVIVDTADRHGRSDVRRVNIDLVGV
jgi:hypothetical protein